MRQIAASPRLAAIDLPGGSSRGAPELYRRTAKCIRYWAVPIVSVSVTADSMMKTNAVLPLSETIAISRKRSPLLAR